MFPLPAFPSRSEHSNGHVGYVQPVSDGDGSHMHHNVPQQRDSIFPQASIHLLYSVRSVAAPSNCTDSCLMFQGHRLLNPPLFPLQGSWCFCVWWSSTSLCWPYLPVTTRCLFPTSSPGLCHVLAVREPSLSWVGSSSCCWRCPTAPGRDVSLVRTAAASDPDICPLNDPPPLWFWDAKVQRSKVAWW